MFLLSIVFSGHIYSVNHKRNDNDIIFPSIASIKKHIEIIPWKNIQPIRKGLAFCGLRPSQLQLDLEKMWGGKCRARSFVPPYQ
jgi:hypothetical protein